MAKNLLQIIIQIVKVSINLFNLSLGHYRLHEFARHVVYSLGDVLVSCQHPVTVAQPDSPTTE